MNTNITSGKSLYSWGAETVSFENENLPYSFGNTRLPENTEVVVTLPAAEKPSPTKLEVVLEKAKRIACLVVSVFSDLGLAIVGGGLALFALCYKSNFDPPADQIKKDKPPILMIHGNGYNEMQWIAGRRYLSSAEYGSVFTLNLDGLLLNQPQLGIDDYAEKVSQKIEAIKELTMRSDVVLIGHSMGGLVASYYAENLSSVKGTTVNHVVAISTPWESPPVLQKLSDLTERYFPSLFKEPKRYKQMRNEEDFLTTLREQVLESESGKRRIYYSISSTADLVAPDKTGCLDVNHKKDYSYLGHFTPMVAPSVWRQVQTWLAGAE